MRYVRPVDFAAFKPSEFHSQVIANSSTGLDSCICICTRVPPGTGTTIGMHTHTGDQFYYVTQGQMALEINGQRATAAPGSLVFIPAGSPHWNWNEGTEDEVHFELIVPAPGPGEAVATPFDSAKQARAAAGPSPVSYVTHLNPEGFNPDRFTQLTLRSRLDGSDHVRFMVARVPPGGAGPGLHIHKFDQIYYVLSGTMRLQIGLEEYTAGPHTLVVLPAGVPHRNWNEDAEPELHINLQVPEVAVGERADYAVRLEAMAGT
jgi:quercetin dioxygenase-like cupin family protein